MTDLPGYDCNLSGAPVGAGLTGRVFRSLTPSAAVRLFVPLSGPGCPDPEAQKQSFLICASQTERLSHPAIVPTLEVTDADGEAILVTRFIDAPTLASAVVPADQRFDVLRAIADGLDFAHRQGVVHGDLKPGNIFLIPGSGPMIADFAISSRARWTSGPLPERLRHSWLSPEHTADPARPVAQSDQYALALISWEMLTGDAPQPGAEARIRARTQSKATRKAGEVLLRSLASFPPSRYPSCRDFVDALAEVWPVVPLAGPVKQGPANKRLIAIAAAALAGLAGTGIYLATRTTQVGRHPAQNPIGDSGPLGQPPPQHRYAPTGPAPEQEPAGSAVAVGTSNGKLSAIPPQAPAPQTGIQRPPDGEVKRSAQAASTVQAPPAVQPPPQPPSAASSGSSTRLAPEQEPAVSATAVGTSNRKPSATPREPPVQQSGTQRPPGGGVNRAMQPSSPAQAPRAMQPSPAVMPQPAIEIVAFSRTTPIQPGFSFHEGDKDLGELGQGDLKLQVKGGDRDDGLTVHWAINGIVMEIKPVRANQTVEYGNAPTAGTYTVAVKRRGKLVQQVVFRIEK